MDLYRNGIAWLEASLEGLSESDLNIVRAEGKWSIRQTALHLSDSNVTTLHRIKFALAENGREYRRNPYDPNKWEEGTVYPTSKLKSSVVLFRALREHGLGAL